MILRIQVRLAYRQIRQLPTCRGWRLVTWTCPTPPRYAVGDERRRSLYRPSLACRVPRDWWPAVLEQSGAALSKALCALKAAATSWASSHGHRETLIYRLPKHRETATAPHDLGASCFLFGLHCSFSAPNTFPVFGFTRCAATKLRQPLNGSNDLGERCEPLDASVPS